MGPLAVSVYFSRSLSGSGGRAAWTGGAGRVLSVGEGVIPLGGLRLGRPPIGGRLRTGWPLGGRLSNVFTMLSFTVLSLTGCLIRLSPLTFTTMGWVLSGLDVSSVSRALRLSVAIR